MHSVFQSQKCVFGWEICQKYKTGGQEGPLENHNFFKIAFWFSGGLVKTHPPPVWSKTKLLDFFFNPSLNNIEGEL